MPNLNLTFLLERETKGAFRYQEVDSNGRPLDLADATVGVLYVRKAALGAAKPKSLTVTIGNGTLAELDLTSTSE
jgi:hypothetical protein